MLCTYCGTSLPDGAKFCLNCGAAVSFPSVPESAEPEPLVSAEETPIPEQYDLPAPTPLKKGTHWIPLMIMALCTVLGLSLFYLLPSTPETGTGNPRENLHGDVNADTPWFMLIDGKLHFTKALYDGPPELTVPETIGGKPVTELGEFCFAYNETITTVILPDTLESIGTNAFAGCTSLRGIFIPEGVTYIGTDAFSGCTALEAICIPASVEYIEHGAFESCANLRYILYSGIYTNWKELYSEYISYKTQVFCTDGTFIHSRIIP